MEKEKNSTLPEMLKMSEVAKILRLSRNGLNDVIDSNPDFPLFKISGKTYRVPSRELQSWMEAKRVSGL